MFKFIILNLLRKIGVYPINELTIGGHCGLCGAWVNDKILPMNWAITICDKCSE